jgi:hypothetical protein
MPYKTNTPVLRNDFIESAERALVIQDADSGAPTLELHKDNPAAGAVAFIQISFANDRHEGSECISLDVDATAALRDALTVLIDEFVENELF